MSHTNRLLGVILEERFCQLPCGSIFSPSGFGDLFWQRYLTTFDEVVIIARLAQVERPELPWSKITDPRVSIHGLPTYIGPLKFLRTLPRVLRSFWQGCKRTDALIVRAPGTLSLLALLFFYQPLGMRKPIAVEMVGDPNDVFNAGVGGRLSGFYKKIFSRSTESLCAAADAILYVTQQSLQTRYPARQGVLTFGCSDVMLPINVFALSPRAAVSKFSSSRPSVVFTVASLEVPYKGVDVLITALKSPFIIESALQIRIAGDGRLRTELEAMARHFGVADRVCFLGLLNRSEVLDEMRRADLYVQPSLTEGLPRAVIEACAVGAPVLASRVGGIPELLDDEDMVEPGYPEALAERMMKTLSDPNRMAAMSARNLETARAYESSLLDTRRNAFYSELCRISSERCNS